MDNGLEAISEKEMMRRDALQEIGSIGAAHASTALSNLTRQDILVEVSESFICMSQDLPTAFENTEEKSSLYFLRPTVKERAAY